MSHIDDLAVVEIETAALNALPESVARETCILPVTIGDGSIHVIHAADGDSERMIDKLQFILNRSVTFDTAPRAVIESAIDHHYPTPQEDVEELNLPEFLPAIDYHAEYRILDLVGKVAFATTASVSLDLGERSDRIHYSDGTIDYVGGNCVLNVFGWVDVHYPCQGFHKLLIRCSLPGNYSAFESMREMVVNVCDLFALPSNVPYKIHLQTDGVETSMEHPQQGFVCTTKWRMPDEDD